MLQGTVPILPEDYLQQKLQPHQRTILQLAMDRQLPSDETSTAEVEAALDALNLTGVWGKRKEGYAYTRAFLIDEERLFVHMLVHAWDDPAVPEEIRSRKFTWVHHPDEMFVKLMAQAQATENLRGIPLTITPEDHPEMDAVGFLAVEDNELWLIKRDMATHALQNKQTSHPEALKMFQTTSGRRALGKILSRQLLTNIQTCAPTMLSNGAGVVKEQRRADERVRIDLKSKSLAAAFRRRKGQA